MKSFQLYNKGKNESFNNAQVESILIDKMLPIMTKLQENLKYEFGWKSVFIIILGSVPCNTKLRTLN